MGAGDEGVHWVGDVGRELLELALLVLGVANCDRELRVGGVGRRSFSLGELFALGVVRAGGEHDVDGIFLNRGKCGGGWRWW